MTAEVLITMDSDQPADDELAMYEDYGLDVMRIDGVPCAEWDGRWLPLDLGEEPPRPLGTMLVTFYVVDEGVVDQPVAARCRVVA